MKALAGFLIVGLFVLSPAYSQQWFTEWYPRLGASDTLENSLRAEMQKAAGNKAPGFSYRRLDDSSTHVLSEESGKVVLVNLWATDCSGCRYEMPALSRLQEKYEGKGFRVIFLSSESRAKLDKFFTLNKTAGVKGTVDRNELERPFQLVVKPSSFLVDRAGVVRDAWLGPKEYEDLENRIQASVAGIVNLEGTWKGKMIQPEGPRGSDGYSLVFRLKQKGRLVSGTSRIEIPQTEYYGVMKVEGTISDDTLHFKEVEVVEQKARSGISWCLKEGSLFVGHGGSHLAGSWTARFCSPGEIDLVKAQ